MTGWNASEVSITRCCNPESLSHESSHQPASLKALREGQARSSVLNYLSLEMKRLFNEINLSAASFRLIPISSPIFLGRLRDEMGKRGNANALNHQRKHNNLLNTVEHVPNNKQDKEPRSY